MAKESRSSAQRSLKELGFTGSGPFEAVVVSHLDPNYMGTLKVDLLRKNKAGSLPERVGTTIEVNYLSPFYGVTNSVHATPNDGYASTQKSYGMWFVPPDAGTKVLVIFAEGDISRGFWIGCVQDQYMNFMIPDGRASTELTTEGTPSELRGRKLPTGEYNKKVQAGVNKDPTLYRKPYNDDFTATLVAQGLLSDESRGTTTSSARREVPSAVFGISTPGPIDKRQGAPLGEYGEFGNKANVFVNRLGGFSFVMDDGDDKLIRKGPASEAPPEYAYVEAGETDGDRTIPHNELLRLRTRTGHQILMHNSEDLIYIGNARGTTWIEMSSNGKIDIYANDSISVHSDQDLNFTADRDVNIEGGRNINMRARGRDSEGHIQMESKKDTKILVEENMKVDVKKAQDIKIAEDRKLTVGGDSHHDVTGSIFELADADINSKASSALNLESGAAFNAKSGAALNLQSASDLNALAGANANLNGTAVNVLGSGVVAIDGSSVALNGGAAGPAGQAGSAQDAQEAEAFEPLLVHSLSKVVAEDLSTITVESIVKRMPSHEPWLQHENLSPSDFAPSNTDITVANAIPDAEQIASPDTFRKNISPSSSSTPATTPTSQVSSSYSTVSSPVSTGQEQDELGLPARQSQSTVPSNLVRFIAEQEGFRAKAFWDEKQYTNGFGTKARSSTEVITREVALQRLEADVARRRAFVIDYGEANGYNWNDGQIDALTSFAFNLGTGAISQVTANGTRSDDEIAEKITQYNKSGGQTLAGLVTRRNEESAWFRQSIA